MSQDHLTLLVVKEDFEPYKYLSANLNDVKKLQPYILEAQMHDIAPAIGQELYADLIANLSDEKYQDLLNGKTYEYAESNVIFPGLKAAIVLYAFARYTRYASVTPSNTGMVQKTNEWSQPIGEKTISAMVDQAQSSGYSYLRQALTFLQRNRADYPKWFGTREAKKRTGMRITSVGKSTAKLFENRNSDDYDPLEKKCDR